MVNDDIQAEILHGGVEVFFDGGVQAVYFIDEEHISFLDICQNTGQISGFFNLRAGGGMQTMPHGVGDDVGKGGFAQPGRAAEQHVVKNVTAHLGSLHHQQQSLFHLLLPTKFAECRRAQR